MVGWHHRLEGHEFEQAPVGGDGILERNNENLLNLDHSIVAVVQLLTRV